MPTFDRKHALSVSESASTLVIGMPLNTAVVFERGEAFGSVRLRFGRGGIGPDVSVQPGVVGAVVEDRAPLVGVDPNLWQIEFLRSLRRWHPELPHQGDRPDQLTAMVGEFTHPLLRPVYAQGVSSVDEVPRWASSILRSASATAAAQRLAGSANRRLVKVLALSLVPDSRIDFGPLALGVAAAGLVSVDELSNILEAATKPGLPDAPLSVDEIRTIRSGLSRYPAARRAALMSDVAEHHDARRLATAMTRLRWVVDWVQGPLPIRLRDLEAMCYRLVPVIAPPSVAAQPEAVGDAVSRQDVSLEVRTPPSPPGRTPQARAVSRAPRRPGRAVLRAPAAPGQAPQRWPVPEALLAISGQQRAGLMLCIPTTAAELSWWSRQLHNCLDTFAAAVAHERSWLVGVQEEGRLIGCVEVCPVRRTIRQAHGPRNRSLSSRNYDTVVQMLREHGLIDSHGAG